MIEPQLVEPAARRGPTADNAMPVRLLETQARGHIGRRLLHQQPDGELTEDPVWRWSSAPDRYLDTALRLELESRSDLRLVDSGNALDAGRHAAGVARRVGREPTPGGRHRAAGHEAERVVHTHVVRGTESCRRGSPAISAAAGKLLRSLASEALNSLAQTR